MVYQEIQLPKVNLEKMAKMETLVPQDLEGNLEKLENQVCIFVHFCFDHIL